MNLSDKIKGVFARVILEVLSTSGYEVSILKGNKATELEHLQEFGMASKPPKGSRGIAAFLAGDRENGTVLLFEHPTLKPTDLADGETVLYNSKNMRIYLRVDGTIHITGTDLTQLILDKSFQHNGTTFGIFSKTAASQPAHVADPIGGATVDAEARTAINSINAAMATLGLTASS